jgi:peptidoglycan hydrolase CwlO-like protein
MRIGRRADGTLRATLTVIAMFALGALGPSLRAPTARADTAAQIKQEQAKLDALLAQVASAQAQSAALQQQVSALLVRIDGTRRQIEATGAQQAATRQREDAAQGQVAAERALVDQRAAEAYMNPLSSIDVILGSSSLADLQDRVAYVGAVGQSDRDLLNSLAQAIAALDAARSQLASQQSSLQASQSSLSSEAADLTASLAQQQSLVATLGQDVQDAQALIKVLTTKRAREIAAAKLRQEHPPAPPVPPPPPPPPPTGSVQDIIASDFAPLGQTTVTQALCVAGRESGFSASAVNPYSGAGGVFQFLPQTWPGVSEAAGYGGRSVFDAAANVGSAEWEVAHFGWSDWQGDGAYCGF